APHRVTRLDAPAPVHAQVAAEDEASGKREVEVLPFRLDALKRPPVEALGEPLHRGPWMRRLDLDPLADENLQLRRDAMKGIAFGHVPKPTIEDMTRRFVGVRWWLGIAFAVVAATSTAIVVQQFSNRSEDAFRRHGQEVALKDAQRAAKAPPGPALG